ncbi:MAG: PAS domain S-box protein [Gammaproteobacteria bacterium]|nr:PAS domain S-box protein [Gammaproteobacteria bacterium]
MTTPDHLTKEQLQLIYNNTSDLVFLIAVGADGTYRLESVNPAYLQRTQLQAGDLAGRTIEDILPRAQFDYVKARYDEAVASGGPFNYQTRTVLRGSDIYLDTTLVPVFDEQGRCTHLIGVSRDITQSKHEQQALKAEKQRAENFLDIAEALIVAVDRNANITLLNRKGYKMLGYPEGSLTGRNWIELFIAPDKQDAFRRGLGHMMNTGNANRNVNYVITRSGERLLISWASAIIRDGDGNVAGLLSSGEDITDRRRAERALIASQRVLAADEVVSAVAHDFNNSLQGILGNIEIAQLTRNDPDRLDKYLNAAAKLADDAARRLRALRGRSGGTATNELENLDLHELIDDVVAQTQPLWKDEAQRHGRNIEIRRQFAQSLRPMSGNRSELRSVLYNIIKNSVEALPSDGEIRIRTHHADGFNAVTISDTGIGMDNATSTRIFQPFFSTKGLEAGRGLGMSASHSIVLAHRGVIRVSDTAPGSGTTIEVRLPASVAPDSAAAGESADPGTRSHNVLWVDDDPEIRALAGNYLAALGHTGDVADSGAAALELLGRHDYSVVVTDVGMPGMSGLELASRICGQFGQDLPVIALTGWGETVQEGDSAPEGILNVLSKPIRLEKLKQVLDSLPAGKLGP